MATSEIREKRKRPNLRRILRNQTLSEAALKKIINELILEYKKIYKIHGKKILNSTWMKKNGYSGFFYRVIKALSWTEFVKRAGFKPLLKRDVIFEDLVLEYKRIRKKYGNVSTDWMKKHEYEWLRYQATTNYGFTWNEFKIKAGFNDNPITLEDSILEFKEIYKEHGKKALSSLWLDKNGYTKILYKTKKLKLSWPVFKEKTGLIPTDKEKLNKVILEYKEIYKEYGEKALRSSWMRKNGYGRIIPRIRRIRMSWSEFLENVGFKTNEKITLDKLILEYKGIYKIHGEKALSSKWVMEHGYRWLYNEVKKHESWREFLKKAGFISEITLEELILEYKGIYKIYGEKALSYTWMKDHGYYKNILYQSKKYKLSWPDFVKRAGFRPVRRIERITIESLTLEYKEIYKEHGEKALSSKWVQKHGYCWLYSRINTHNLLWSEFVKKAGFKPLNPIRPIKTLDELILEFKRIYKEHGKEALSYKWMCDHGYRSIIYRSKKSYNLLWSEFVKKAGFKSLNPIRPINTLNELILEYKKIYKEHGEKTLSSKWLQKYGYCWLYNRIKRYNLLWPEFVKKAGFSRYPYDKIKKSLKYQGFSDPTIRKIIRAMNNNG